VEPSFSWVDNHPTSPTRSRRRRLAVIGLAVAVLTVIGLAGVRSWQERSTWPTDCRVAANPSWCAEPSDAMTDPAMVTLVRDYCPWLADTAAEQVVPQPLEALGLAGPGTYATTSGDETNGTEDALLGRPGAVAWLTRWVGGQADGRVELRCPGQTATVPGLRLEQDQFRSSVAAAVSADGRNIDFAEVARQSVSKASSSRPTGVSYGFIGCDTDGIDLAGPAVGETFECVMQIYAPEGQGAYPLEYRVIDDHPWFAPVDG